MMGINEQTQVIARDVYFGDLDQDEDVYNHIMSKPYVSASRNPYIVVSEHRPLVMLPLQTGEQDIHYIYGKKQQSDQLNIGCVFDACLESRKRSHGGQHQSMGDCRL